MDFIKKFGKLIDKTGILTNITDGGDETKCNMLGGDNPHSKKVYQYSLNGNFIRKWDCLREIGRILNVNYNSIGDCCRRITKTSHGHIWSYRYKGKKIQPIKPREQPLLRKKVYKFDSEGNLIQIYNSLLEASNKNNIEKTNLSKTILTNKFYKKYFFSYYKNFKPIKKVKIGQYYKIKYNNKIDFLTNKEIIKIFNVSKYYITEVKRGRIKNPRFILLN